MAGEVEPQEEASPAPAAAKVSTAKAEVKAKELSEAELREAFDKVFEQTTYDSDEEDEDTPATSKRAYKDARRQGKKTTTADAPQDAAEEDDDDDLEDPSDEEEKIEDDDDGSDEEDDDDEAEDDDDEADSALDKAYKVLALDGFTAGDLKNLSKERIIALAEKASKRQSDVAKKLQAKAEQEKAKSDEAGTRPDAEDGDDATTSKGLRVDPKRLKAVFDDEAAEAIAGTVEGFIDGVGGEFKKTLEGMQSQLTELAMENFRYRLQRLMPEHADDLDDGRTWGRVVKRMAALRQVNEHRSADELAREALAAVFKDRNTNRSPKRGEHDPVTPRAPTNRRTPPRPMDRAAIERAIFETSTDPKLTIDQRRQKLRELSAMRSK